MFRNEMAVARFVFGGSFMHAKTMGLRPLMLVGALVGIAWTNAAAAAPTFIWALVSGSSAASAFQPSATAPDKFADVLNKKDVQVYALSGTPITEHTSASASLGFVRATAQQTNTISFGSTSSGVFTHTSSSSAVVLPARLTQTAPRAPKIRCIMSMAAIRMGISFI